jgi:hypothetical protein
MSDSHIRDIMYLGPKLRKTDNVTGTDGRVWHGLGDVQRTTLMEALKLTKHDFWKDVTDWPETKRVLAISDAQKRYAQAQRISQSQVTLENATEEELEAMLRAKRKPVSLPGPNSIREAPKPGRAGEESVDDDEGLPVSRPEKIEEVIAAITGAVLQLDPGRKELFDENDNPTPEAVTDALGYKISAKELKAALKQIG